MFDVCTCACSRYVGLIFFGTRPTHSLCLGSEGDVCWRVDKIWGGDGACVSIQADTDEYISQGTRMGATLAYGSVRPPLSTSRYVEILGDVEGCGCGSWRA